MLASVVSILLDFHPGKALVLGRKSKHPLSQTKTPSRVSEGSVRIATSHATVETPARCAIGSPLRISLGADCNHAGLFDDAHFVPSGSHLTEKKDDLCTFVRVITIRTEVERHSATCSQYSPLWSHPLRDNGNQDLGGRSVLPATHTQTTVGNGNNLHVVNHRLGRIPLS